MPPVLYSAVIVMIVMIVMTFHHGTKSVLGLLPVACCPLHVLGLLWDEDGGMATT